ncbi:MAG: hypothetical protein EAX86_00085 [Candidatus Heimdallarchaeota archaeon]|nr:hypothetical protein [Candidatus Heimdallarchaeota archaeon]
MSKEPVKTTNPLLNMILVFSAGLSALELAQLVFDPANVASLTSLEFNEVLAQMFRGMYLSASTITSFWAVLIAWIIAGMIAGVRAKHGFWGGIAGFFGTIIGIGFLVVLNIDILTSSDVIEFFGGAAACILVATISAYATGNATKPKQTLTKTVKTRKAWDASKTKDVWTCSKCGNTIPPGAFQCPICSEPVIE